MGEKIGIKLIAPDVEMKDDTVSSPTVQKDSQESYLCIDSRDFRRDPGQTSYP